MNEELKALGYQTDVLFLDTTAPDPFERNAADVAALIQAGARVLIIGQQRYQMDSAVLDQARAEGIIVIGYDGLIFNSDSVDYATGFNVAAVGRLQGEYLRDTLGLETSDASHTFEVLPDMADEFTAPILVSAWEVLGPYYASGKLTCLSKKCPSKVGNPWGVGPNTPAGEIAVASLYLRLASTYKTERLEVVLSPTSDYAISAIKALEKLGYQPGADWPILTGYSEDIGWDGTHKSLGYILAGIQSMTVFEDSLRVATASAQMVDQILRCEPIETTHGQYDGAKNVPTLTLDPIVVTKDNIWETVITPGYYTAEQLGL
ncbi:MAG: substrate-binding domain-containing protein [Micrococcales bacterium]|nr:substrate-binding domain-containing protein [Micrococcales bacterium]